MKKHITNIILFTAFSINCFAQKNLDFEHWDINHLGIDQAIAWVNVCDASKYGAPQVLFKEVENPASGLASIKLITKYWKQGKDYKLDTLVGALIQHSKYNKKPKSFEFSYQAFPKKGDQVLVGVQLSTKINGEKIIVGEGYFTSGEKQKNWKKTTVEIRYFSDLLPTEITLMILSSANATIATGEYGYPKIGSKLLVDDIQFLFPEKHQNLTLLNTVK